jgi:hypothetical protein
MNGSMLSWLTNYGVDFSKAVIAAEAVMIRGKAT